ncbi:beta-ketoacyl-ACP synthase [Bartonella sp. HY038]|uniref:beta-ketoacyl-ACP synthase n=1 Tax=Bartonella sp. HY038 TaxID=2759660 RepID=UPI0015FB1CA3|nr:beta-ketoacyl-ACP synthase [Bartonella sp. HY038]
MQEKSVFITGIGLISSLGEGVDHHWQQINGKPQPNLDEARFAPYMVHALGEVDWNSQIPKRSDQRQMETWQRLGTYAAGLALEDAGMKGNEALTSTMDMIVAAGGGERDINVDQLILSKGREAGIDREVLLNKMLSTELRPTLFLAQLSNLLAGNISIVHKVTGSSRTFMGEEGSGIAALETAAARIRGGQSTHTLVGASYNSEHYDMLLGYALGGYLQKDKWSSVWERDFAHGGGAITGTSGVFLVLEEAEQAKARGATIYGELKKIVTDQTNRKKQPLEVSLTSMLDKVGAKDNDFAISGASGIIDITNQERAALEKTGLSYRGFASLFGHMREAQFLFATALAAIAVQKQSAFPPLSTNEKAYEGEVKDAFAITAGVSRAEGIAHITRA